MENAATWPGFRRFEQNASATLLSGLPSDTEIFVEDMSRGLFDEPEIAAEEAALIRHKYSKMPPDVVIAVANVPLNLFPGVPLVYVGGTFGRSLPGPTAPAMPVVGVWMSFDGQSTVQQALRLQPKARQIVVIGGEGQMDRTIMAQVRAQLSSASIRLPVLYWTDLAVPELLHRVAALRPDTIVLYTSLSKDGSGRSFVPAEITGRVAESSGAPVYILYDTAMGTGAVGGYLISTVELGKQAGLAALRLLAGEHPGDVDTPDVYTYDWRQLQRWHLSESALPPGSLVLNREPSIWELDKVYIVGAVVLFLLETLLVFGLLWQRAARKKVEESLRELLAFEHLLTEISQSFVNLPEERLGPHIEKSLGRIGEFLHVGRMVLHQYSHDGAEMVVTFSWLAPGVSAGPQAVRTSQFPWWTGRLLRGETVLISDPDELPVEASAERDYIRTHRSLSVASVPLKAGGEYFGSLSFSSTTRRVEWGKALVERLKMLAEIFSNALIRKRAQDARFRHAAVVESSDDAIISKSLDGIIQSWNAGAERIFGYTEAEVVGQSIFILVPPELRDEEDALLDALHKGERVAHLETVRVAKDGKRVDVSLTVSPVRDSAGKLVGASKIARDITDRKRAERVLRESEERFRLVANTAPVLIWMSGKDKLCTFFNQGWLDFTGQTLEHELGEGWTSGVHPDDLEHCLREYSSSFDVRMDFEIEYRLRRHDGEFRWVADYGVPRFESDGQFCGYIGSVVDITERKSSEAALQELSGRLIHAQEEERTRIARELHDDFNQRLALLSIGLGQMWKHLPESDRVGRVQLGEMWTRTKELSSDIHRLCHQLHSSKLDLVGLASALNGLCKEMGESYQVTVEFAERGTPSNIPKDVALCLFRAAQEALNNVIKHSGAKQARVELSSANGDLILRIKDDGMGFDPAESNSAAGIGLIGMRERLRLVGGSLSVRSAPKQGTEIIAEVPLAERTGKVAAKSQFAGGRVR